LLLARVTSKRAKEEIMMGQGSPFGVEGKFQNKNFEIVVKRTDKDSEPILDHYIVCS
jgi:hypothetical protein